MPLSFSALSMSTPSFRLVAADPGGDRHRRFLKSDTVARLDADDDARKVGVPLLDAESRAKFKTTLAHLAKG